jgi:CRP-like cAMP-binding protein
MSSTFKSLLSAAVDTELPGWASVAAQITVLSLDAGATVFEQGVCHPYLYAVQAGLVKLRYLDEDGSEWVKSFAEEGRYFASIAALRPSGR